MKIEQEFPIIILRVQRQWLQGAPLWIIAVVAVSFRSQELFCDCEGPFWSSTLGRDGSLLLDVAHIQPLSFLILELEFLLYFLLWWEEKKYIFKNHQLFSTLFSDPEIQKKDTWTQYPFSLSLALVVLAVYGYAMGPWYSDNNMNFLCLWLSKLYLQLYLPYVETRTSLRSFNGPSLMAEL